MTIVNTALKRSILGGILFIASAGLLSIHLPALASGSIGVGGGKTSPKKAYTQGKVLLFKKLVCSKSKCPIKRNELNRARAISLAKSLEARDKAEADKPGTSDDENIKVLCPGERAGNCTGTDEQEFVHHYLTRRYKLKKK
jgi:hypothetical protein